jgi:hypothetical protein
MMPGWRYRFPLLHGCWVAIAQNVAPRRFHARERRLHEEEQRRMLTSSNLPTFALAGTGPDEVKTRFVSGFGTVQMVGPLRRRRGVVASSLSTTQGTPGGGTLRFTSQRPSGEGIDEHRRALLVHNFVASCGLAQDQLVERHNVTLLPGLSHDLLSVPGDAWSPHQVRVDGERYDFERATIGDHWLAIGLIDDAEVAIEGHSFDPEPLDLVRLDRPASPPAA